MSTPLVKDFFNNKVTIRLKNGHRFEGLLSQINYKNQAVILEDVEDLGN
jgi:small nuclear ribonucleoprotein (snRNP)-like protein